MDELGRKISKIDWAKLQRQAKKVQASTASALKDLVMTDLENKVRAATADTTWGASSSDLMEIAQGTFHREDYALIMSIVWQRLGSSRWRCVYKALEVLRNLIMHGSSRCLEDARAAQHHIQTLEHYRFVDPGTHRDEGENVRVRAALVVSMIADAGILEEEREKDKELRAKVGAGTGSFGTSQGGGISSDDYRYGSRHGGSSRSGGTTGLYGGSAAHGEPIHTSYSGRQGSSGGATEKQARASHDSRNGCGYDDEPRGAFGALSRKAAEGATTADTAASAKSNALVSQSIDDLLGDGNTVTTSGPVVGDDDDDFNPRGAGSGGNGNGVELDMAAQMLGSLGLNDTGDTVASNTLAIAAPGGTTGAAVPTSQLVQNLAAQANTAPVTAGSDVRTPALAEAEAAAAVEAKRLSAGEEDSAYGGLVRFDNILLDKDSRVDPKHSVNGAAPLSPPPAGLVTPSTAVVGEAKPKTPLQKEIDPFADLLSTAKQSGVL